MTADLLVPDNPAYNRSSGDNNIELGDGYIKILMTGEENQGPKNSYKYKIRFTTPDEGFPYSFPVDFDADPENDGRSRILISGNLTIQ
ncbi:hypothetical protein WJR50_18800 [Catalinimonas sp. 4WD22]|uniref:hypothetical protein n=1 Tax=Catalinimonas locisalis TaxID=3133978 RepID=UPI003100EF5C